jgi:hypothetical protein
MKVSIVFLVCFVAGALVPQSSAITIDCEFASKSSGHWTVVGEAYTCYIRNIEVTKKEVVTEIKGSHEGTFTNGNLKALNIYGKTCNVIPSGFDTFFTDVEAFSVNESHLKTVTNEDLKQFPKLREIWLYTNDLEFLPSNLFEFNPKVEYIVFKHNKISYVGAEFFNYLPNLSKASFYSNVCINSAANELSELPALKKDIFDGCAFGGTTELDTTKIDFTNIGPLVTEHDIVFKGSRAASVEYVEYLQYRMNFFYRVIQKYQTTSGCKLA